jgi:hypothetical protein
VTRPLEDKASEGNPRNGTPFEVKDHRFGAIPRKKGKAVRVLSRDSSRRCVRAGNDSCIAAVSCSTWGLIMLREISHTRSLCSSAAMTLPTTPNSSDHTLMGKGGQICNILLTGVLYVQRMDSLRRIGDACTTCLHGGTGVHGHVQRRRISSICAAC